MSPRAVTSVPLGARPTSLAWNAPSIDMGEQLAAFTPIFTGIRSDWEKPALRKCANDHRLDWAPLSATAETSHAIVGALLATLSTVTVTVTRGCSLNRVRRHSPLLKIWCSIRTAACDWPGRWGWQARWVSADEARVDIWATGAVAVNELDSAGARGVLRPRNRCLWVR